MALLEVENLTVRLPTARGPATALREVGFSLERGEAVGVVGESGSGKSMLALAILGLLPEGAEATGTVRFAGRDLLTAPEPELCRLRGDRIGIVFQEPMTALNPLHRIGDQVAEPLVLHRGVSEREAQGQAARLLERVGLPDVPRLAASYPHQLSGGQRQRVAIAMALACRPDLLIADEPTTALDVTVQSRILDLIAGLVAETGMALLLVSHDLGVVAENVDRVLVMYGGTVVESAPAAELFRRPAHPYTQRLLAARPRLGLGRGVRLPTIPGTVPELADLPPGCPFAGRCPLTIDACRTTFPPPEPVGPGHRARCIRLDVALADVR